MSRVGHSRVNPTPAPLVRRASNDPLLTTALEQLERGGHHGALRLLTTMADEMAAVDEASLKKARSALAPLFWRTIYPTHERCEAALGTMTLADLPAVLRASVERVPYASDRSNVVEALTRRFAARPGMAWAAVMWLSQGGRFALQAIEAAIGEAIAEPLRARLEMGLIEPSMQRTALEILGRRDATGSFQVFVDRVADESVRPAVVEGMRAALEAAGAADGAQVSPVRRWLAASLEGPDGSAMAVALEVLARRYDPGLMPALERLRGADLGPTTRRKLATALVAPEATDAPRQRSERALSATLLHKVKGPIQSLHVSVRGTVLAVQADDVHVFRGERATRISDPGKMDACLSLGGRYVLVQREFNVAVHVPSEGSEMVDELSPGDGFGAMVPLPGGHLITLSAANNNPSPLLCWDLGSGGRADHSKAISHAWMATALDRERYVVGGMAGDVVVVAIASGKALLKLGARRGAGGSGLVDEVCAGGGQVLARQDDGTLRFWSVGSASFELLAEHVERARGAKLAVDRRSSWAATLHSDHVQPWRSGQPARPLCAERGPPDPCNDRRSFVFVRRGVLAVGGEGLDLWDLDAGKHLGRLEQAVTALCAHGERLYAGDARGRVFRVDVPGSPS